MYYGLVDLPRFEWFSVGSRNIPFWCLWLDLSWFVLWDCGFCLGVVVWSDRGSGLSLWCFDLLPLMVACGVGVVLDCVWWICLDLMVCCGVCTI